jgi:cobalamin biosynthesis Mg chelatase CobN
MSSALPPSLPIMAHPNCTELPPLDAALSPAAWWNETYADPLNVCGSLTADRVLDCCGQLGGEARGACGRAMCLTDQPSPFLRCVREVGVCKRATKAVASTASTTASTPAPTASGSTASASSIPVDSSTPVASTSVASTPAASTGEASGTPGASQTPQSSAPTVRPVHALLALSLLAGAVLSL